MNVFVAGARAISKLNNDIKARLSNISANETMVLVGDANGVDKAVQQFFHHMNYPSVLVYAMKGKPRNNIGNWDVKKVDADNNAKGFDYYVIKDVKMAEDADYGFMIWNGKSRGTLNNIINMVNLGKKVLVYFSPDKMFYTIHGIIDFEVLIQRCDSSVLKIVKKLNNFNVNGKSQQLSFDNLDKSMQL